MIEYLTGFRTLAILQGLCTDLLQLREREEGREGGRGEGGVRKGGREEGGRREEGGGRGGRGK